MSLTNLEKNIYNTFLASTRSIKNKPFTIRQDFSKIDDKTYVILKKLSSLFTNNRNINIGDYFIAPYMYYGKNEYFDLSFYTTPKAVKCYSLYKKKKELQDPDNETTIEECKQCCKFIYTFCQENNLSVNDYKKTINGTTPIILQHLKDHYINFYTIHALECDSIINRFEPELLDFIIQDFKNIMHETRINFSKSSKLKNVLREALTIIDRKLLKNITPNL